MKEGLRRNFKKVCIIGFDSFDYYLIEKYNLRYIKQKEFGRVDMTEFGVELLSTPAIWTSFISGLPPAEHDVIGWKWNNPALDKLKRWSVKIGLGKIVVGSRYLTRLTSKMIKDKYTPNIKGRIPTIFDYAKYPVDIDVPCYSRDAYEELRHEVTYGLGNPIVEKRITKKAWRAFWKKKEAVLHTLMNNWDLFMAHFYLPDIIQHLLWYRDDEIKRLYREMDNTAHLIQESVGDKTFILFISDHGQESGLHTPNAFYSSNQKLGLHKPKMTDFADIIRQRLGVPSKGDIEKVKKRLQELGYI